MATIIGTEQDDTLEGGDGDDSIAGLAGNDLLLGQGGNDTLTGGAGNDVLAGNAGSDTLEGGDGDDVLLGFDSNSGLDPEGRDGADLFQGGAGNDLLRGNSGNDTLEGGDGDDNLRGDAGDDLLDGGAGVDAVAYRFDEVSLAGGVNFDASDVGTAHAVVLADGLGGTDTLIAVERVLIGGSAFADTLVGGVGNDQIIGNAGDDRLQGGHGDDLLFGGEGNDQLFGGDGDDLLDGGAGDDLLDGGDGVDRAYFDFERMATSAGIDFDGSQVGKAQSVVLADEFGGQDTLNSIEALVIVGTAFDDTLTGSQGDDAIYGLTGNDGLYGEAGNDSIWGDAGRDSIRGGAGDDQLVGEDGDDALWGDEGNDMLDGGDGFDVVLYTDADGPVTVDLAQGKASGADGDDVLSSIEGIVGSDFADTLIGDGANNFIRGRKGNDTIDGGGGVDRAAYDLADGPVTVNLLTGTSSGADGDDKLTSIENLRGSNFGDTLIGDDGANDIQGRGGNDTLIGNGGDDFLSGDDGDDLIDGGPGFDTADYFFFGHKSGIVANLSTGRVTGGGGNDTLVGIEYVNGTNFDDLFIGDAADNVFWGNGGDDTLDGGEGGDMAYYSRAAGGVTVNLALGKASGADGNDVLISIEFATGSDFDDVLIGDAQGNFIRGRRGDDFIDGGAGSDRAAYDLASGPVTVSLATGSANGADGNDTLVGIENLRGSNFGDTLIGDDGPNNIQARAGNDAVYGGGGNDYLDGELGDDALYGEAGNDTLVGGSGNDALYGGDGEDLLIGGAGNDTLDGGSQPVQPGRTRYDFANYEFASGPVTVNLAAGTATGEGNDVLIDIEGVVGSSFSDTLSGDANDNWFIGLGGDDTIDGGGGIDGAEYRSAPSAVTVDLVLGKASGGHGNDVLIGIEWVEGSAFDDTLIGSGNDEFLRGGPGNDTIDGGGGTDRADYRRANGSVFVNLAAGLATGADGNDVLRNIEDARGSDTFADTLIGEAGPNFLEGRGGDDLLVGLAGDDMIDGGDGYDTARFVGNRSSYGIVGGATVTVAGPDGTDSLVAVERLQFADVDVVFDVDGIPGQGYRLYQAAFARTPDTPGLSYWIVQMQSGASLEQVAEAFIGSAEFIGLYGPNPSNAQFVTQLYNNVLGRGPDAAGLAYWVGLLENNLITRPQVLVGFSESTENKANLLPVLQNGIGYQPLAPIAGTAGNDVLSGTAGADWILGQGGRDLITGAGGHDILDGGEDLDTAAYSGERGSYTVVAQAGNLLVIDNSGTDGIDTLVDVERLRFTDKALAFDIDGNAGQGYRLYQAAFDRTPDIAGLSFWIHALDSGAALLDVAQAFLGSAEFQGLYGANPTDVEFISLLYLNVLDRLPDQSGYDFWLNALGSGAITRAGVLVEFSESAENQANLIGVLQQGIEYLPVI